MLPCHFTSKHCLLIFVFNFDKFLFLNLWSTPADFFMEKNDFKRFCVVIILTLTLHLITMPVLLYGQKMNVFRISFLIFHNFLAFWVYFFMALVKKKKGFVEYNEQTTELLRKEPNKYCILCDNYKPERAHHCSKCRQCVRKMDHHCMWLGNCVNNDNLGHFIRMLLYAVLSLLVLSVFSIYSIVRRDRFGPPFLFRIILVFVVTIAVLSSLLFLALGFFLIERFIFVLKNLTYLESCNLEAFKENGMHHLIKSPYNLGWWKNLQVQMGKPYFLYMYGEEGDGLFFEKNFECEQWPPRQMVDRWRRYNEIPFLP